MRRQVSSCAGSAGLHSAAQINEGLHVRAASGHPERAQSAVLIPVVVRNLSGLRASIATQRYTFEHQRNEAIRKERAAQLERAMVLAARCSNDVDKLIAALAAMMVRLDEIVDSRGRHKQEDAAAFGQRIQMEIAPTMNLVRMLMKKLGDPAI